MFDFYEQSEEMKNFITHAGLEDLADRLDDLTDKYDMKEISLESFGPLDRGLVALSVGSKDLLVATQRIDVEYASTLRAAALASATEDQLFDLLYFFKKALFVAYNSELKGWIKSCISATKLALKEKL